MKNLLEMARDLSLGNRIKIHFLIYEPIHEEMILTLLGQSLSYYHLNYLENIISTIINELINNAGKANLKRIFFQKHTKDINDNREYLELIREFKEEAVVHLKSYGEDFKREGLYIEFSMQMSKKGIEIQITNNIEMTSEEKDRVRERIQNASRLNSMAEAFDLFGNDDEGAGLGIVLNIQLLKNAGIESDHFRIHSENGITKSTVFIPTSIRKPENLEKIHSRILEEIFELPIFSENTKEVLELCRSEAFSIGKIIPFLEKDPGLSYEVIRESSILSYGKREFNSLREACEFLGKEGLFQAISTCSSRRIMESRYDNFQIFWGLSRRCAFYSRELANELQLPVSQERLYLAGMFHNLGKLIIYSLHPDIVQSVSNTTMEEIQMGVSNSQVGSLVAEKWGYSKDIVSLLKNYPRPMSAPEELRMETCILHVADFLIKSMDKRENFIYLDVNALNKLGLEDRASLFRIQEKMDSLFIDTNSDQH